MRRAVAEAYDQAADSYDSWSWQGIWPMVEGAWLRQHVVNPGRVVVFGIGTGAGLDSLADADVVGVDLSAGMLRHARRRLPRARLIQADARSVPLGEGSAELVVCVRMLSHVPNPVCVVREARRLLVRGGLFLLADVSPRHPYGSTRVPVGNARIEVPTWKHAPTDLLDGGWRVHGHETSRALDLPRRAAVVAGAGARDVPFEWRLAAEAM